MNRIEIRQAQLEDMDNLVALFDEYRMFYGRDSDSESAREFLTHRLSRGESVVLLAFMAEAAVGFTQLYPSFSSVSLARTYILNDLFVRKNARRNGIARALIEAAQACAINVGAIRLTLSTAVDNDIAQAAYDATGWQRDKDFLVYHWSVNQPA